MYQFRKNIWFPLLVGLGCVTIGFLPFAVAGDNVDANAAYRDAQLALRQGDCKSAVQHLVAYKRLAASTLKNHPEFAKKVEAQIVICNKQLDSTVRPEKFNIKAW